MRSNGSSKYHYEWNFNDGNSGFIVHGKSVANGSAKSTKMFIDSNGNGILDDSDELISKGKLEKSFRKQRHGRLIEKMPTALSQQKPMKHMIIPTTGMPNMTMANFFPYGGIRNQCPRH